MEEGAGVLIGDFAGLVELCLHGGVLIGEFVDCEAVNLDIELGILHLADDISIFRLIDGKKTSTLGTF